MKLYVCDDFGGILKERTLIEETDISMSDYFMGLGANNTISDFVIELYESTFREILGDDVMDRALGSFSGQELFRVMSMIFLQDGNQKIYGQLVRQD